MTRHLPRSNREGGAIQIEEQVAIEAHTVFEEHIVKVEILFKANGRLLTLQAVHGGINGFHKPQHLTSVHDILVDEELIFFVKRLGGLGDDDGIIRGKSLHILVFMLGAMNQGINPAIDGHRIHDVVLCQRLHNVVHILRFQLTMALNESDVRSLKSGHLLHSIDEAEFEILHRSIQGVFRRLT